MTISYASEVTRKKIATGIEDRAERWIPVTNGEQIMCDSPAVTTLSKPALPILAPVLTLVSIVRALREITMSKMSAREDDVVEEVVVAACSGPGRWEEKEGGRRGGGGVRDERNERF